MDPSDLSTVVGGDSGVIVGKSKGLELILGKANKAVAHTQTRKKDTQINMQTYQELLSVHKNMILGNVNTVPGQS